MPELENVEKVKVAGFVDPRPRKNKNAERIKKDEEELQELLKAKEQGGEPAEEVKEVSAAEKQGRKQKRIKIFQKKSSLLRKDTVIYGDTWQQR